MATEGSETGVYGERNRCAGAQRAQRWRRGRALTACEGAARAEVRTQEPALAQASARLRACRARKGVRTGVAGRDERRACCVRPRAPLRCALETRRVARQPPTRPPRAHRGRRQLQPRLRPRERRRGARVAAATRTPRQRQRRTPLGRPPRRRLRTRPVRRPRSVRAFRPRRADRRTCAQVRRSIHPALRTVGHGGRAHRGRAMVSERSRMQPRVRAAEGARSQRCAQSRVRPAKGAQFPCESVRYTACAAHARARAMARAHVAGRRGVPASCRHSTSAAGAAGPSASPRASSSCNATRRHAGAEAAS